MSNYTFATMPSVNIARSKFVRTQPHNTSYNLGELVVLGLDEVIPGSTHKIELGSLVRMSTPIAPIMDDIQMDVFSFFVPMRLTWDHWKQFMGESEQAGIPTTTYTIPKLLCCGSEINTIADDMGIFPKTNAGQQSFRTIGISALPFRAMGLIYNRFFRNQNVEAPILIYTGDNGYVLQGSSTANDQSFTGCDLSAGSGVTYNGRLIAYKLPDYITSSLPYAQKGDPVQIFGNNAMAPVVTGNTHAMPSNGSTGIIPALYSKVTAGTSITAGTYGSDLLLYPSTNALGAADKAGGVAVQNQNIAASNYWANLSSAVNTTINDLRFAFQLQKALEKDSMYGSRYWEVLRAHYAVTSPDSTLQDPELLGHIKFDINISQVLQTTGYSSPSSTSLGTPGANSVTANKGHLFTASFVEHGYLIHIGVARQKRHTYSQQLNRMWTRDGRFDFYHPVFANLGAQKVYAHEVRVPRPTESIVPTDVFGYQEAWAEYRFLSPFNSGLLNPYRAGALDYWTLADDYTTTPTLSKSFLLESRDNISRALVTGSTGPDFIGSFFIKDTVVNPMPLYSIPGFADHH